jgi:hypothetical protein
MGMMPLLAALLQSEITDGERTSEETTIPVIQEQVGSTLDETGDRLAGVKELFDGTISYLNSPQFFANTIATVIVISLSIIFYRVTIHLLPRILHWSRLDDEASLDVAALARIKRQDTAVTLIRNTLRRSLHLQYLRRYRNTSRCRCLDNRRRRRVRGAELPARHHRGVLYPLRESVQRR